MCGSSPKGIGDDPVIRRLEAAVIEDELGCGSSPNLTRSRATWVDEPVLGDLKLLLLNKSLGVDHRQISRGHTRVGE